MEFNEGKSLSWNPLTNEHSSSNQLSFITSGLHPASCCLCAISSEIQNEVVLRKEEAISILVDEEYSDDDRTVDDVTDGHALRTLDESANCEDELTPSNGIEVLENSLESISLQEFESCNTFDNKVPFSLKDNEHICHLKLEHNVAIQPEEIENVDPLEDTKDSTKEYFENEELSKDIFLKNYLVQNDAVQNNDVTYNELKTQNERLSQISIIEGSSVDGIESGVDKFEVATSTVHRELKLTVFTVEEVNVEIDFLDKFTVEKNNCEGEDHLSSCCDYIHNSNEFSEHQSATELEDDDNNGVGNVNDVTLDLDNEEIHLVGSSDNNDKFYIENYNELFATVENNLEGTENCEIRLENDDEFILPQSDHLKIEINPVIQMADMQVAEVEITRILEHEELDETSDYSSQGDGSLSCDGSTNTENFTNDNLSEKEEEIENQNSNYEQNEASFFSVDCNKELCIQSEENCEIPYSGIISDVTPDDVASAVNLDSSPSTLESTDEVEILKKENVEVNFSLTSSPIRCTDDCENNLIFHFEEKNEKIDLNDAETFSIPESDKKCVSYDLYSPESESPSSESAATSSGFVEKSLEDANEDILYSEAEAEGCEKDDSNLIAFSTLDIEINSCASFPPLQEISIKHCIDGEGEEKRREKEEKTDETDEGGQVKEGYRNDIQEVEDSDCVWV